MEKNARMLEVDVVSEVTLRVRRSPFLSIAPASPDSDSMIQTECSQSSD